MLYSSGVWWVGVWWVGVWCVVCDVWCTCMVYGVSVCVYMFIVCYMLYAIYVYGVYDVCVFTHDPSDNAMHVCIYVVQTPQRFAALQWGGRVVGAQRW